MGFAFALIGAITIGYSWGYLWSTEADGHHQPHMHLLGLNLIGIGVMIAGSWTA